MQTNQMLCEKICETIGSLTELPEDFTYDYPLFDQFDGRPHLSLSSLNALELVVLIYETWGMSFAAMRDDRLAGYVLVTQNSPTKNAFREETLNMLAPTVTVSENYFLKK